VRRDKSWKYNIAYYQYDILFYSISSITAFYSSGFFVIKFRISAFVVKFFSLEADIVLNLLLNSEQNWASCS